MSDSHSFVGSYPIGFKIGSARKEIYIHEALVKQHFGILWNAYLKNPHKAQDIFGQVDEDTFVRFVEFAYTGDYSVPHPAAFPIVNENEVDPRTPTDPDVVLELNEPSTDPAPLEECIEEAVEITDDHAIPEAPEAEEVTNFHSETSWNGWLPKKAAKKKRKQLTMLQLYSELPPADDAIEEEPAPATGTKKEILWNSFTSLALPKVIPPWEPDASADANLDFSPIFLSHASLYVFADQFAIPTLRELTLDKLRLTLSRFDLISERTDAIAQLLKYTYTKTKDSEENPDKLRELVIDYATCHVEKLAENRAFLDLLGEPGSLCKDLVLKVLLRLD